MLEYTGFPIRRKGIFSPYFAGQDPIPAKIHTKHRFISFGKGAPSPVFNPDWALKLGTKDNKKRKPIMKVNSVYGLLLAVQSGVGLAALPDYITVSVPNIIRVLPKIEGPKTEAHFVYPQSLRNVARVQTFRNFLYSKII